MSIINSPCVTPDIGALFVTYEMNETLLRNVQSFSNTFTGQPALIIDNSSAEYKHTNPLEKSLHSVSSAARYVDHTVNSRFAAYNQIRNLAATQYVVFRTDDDTFDERALASILDQTDIKTFAVTPHFFNGEKQWGSGYQHPLEAIIFKRQFLLSLLPFSDSEGGDWDLLRRAFEIAEPEMIDIPVLDKVPHGRPGPIL